MTLDPTPRIVIGISLEIFFKKKHKSSTSFGRNKISALPPT
jgi:hypothetical protein